MPISIPVSPKVQQDISTQPEAAAPDVFKNVQSSAGKYLEGFGVGLLDAGSRLHGVSNEINREVYLGKADDEKRMLAAEKESQHINSLVEAEKKKIADSIVEERKKLERQIAVNQAAADAQAVVNEFKLLEGVQAVNSFDNVGKQVGSIVRETLKTFEDDELQYLLVAGSLDTKITPMIGGASSHSAKQLLIATTKAQTTALDQSIGSSSQAIVEGNYSYAQSEQGAALQIAYQLAEKEGVVIRNDDGTLTDEGKKVTLGVSSRIVSGALDAMVADNNYIGAYKLLNNAEKSSEINDRDRNRVRKAISTGNNMQVAQSLAFETYSNFFQKVEEGKARGDGFTEIEGKYGQPSVPAMLDYIDNLVEPSPTVKKLAAGYLRERYEKIVHDLDVDNKGKYAEALRHKEAGTRDKISAEVMNSLTPAQQKVILNDWADESDPEVLTYVTLRPDLMVGKEAYHWAGDLTRADWTRLYIRANGDKEGKGKVRESGDIALINRHLYARGKNELAKGAGLKGTEKAKLINRFYYQVETLMEATGKPVDYKAREEIINTVIDDIVYAKKGWIWGGREPRTNVSLGYIESKAKNYAEVDYDVYDMSTFTVDEIRLAKQQLTEEGSVFSSYEKRREEKLTLTAANIARKVMLNREKVRKNVRGN